MKIGYIASDLHRLTFELNEVKELLRQKPETRIYTFYGRGRGSFQEDRMRQITRETVSAGLVSSMLGFLYLAGHRPLRLLASAVALAYFSLPNPFYWVKNLVVFWIAMPVLADAAKCKVTHLHANFGSSPATIAWLGRKLLGTTFSITFHAFDIYDQRRRYRDPLKRLKLQGAGFVVAVHEHGLHRLQELLPPLDHDKFKVLRICVDFEPKQKPRILPTPPLILAAGNLVPKKGFDVLVRAVGILSRRGVQCSLRILGEGEDRQRLQSLIEREGVVALVKMPGYYQNQQLAEHLAEASVFAMPSVITPDGDRDGIPTVVVEAWISGTPVVASLVGGMSEVLVNEVSGLTFGSGDAESLANCISRLLADRHLQDSLAESGRHIALKLFSPSENVAALLSQIQSLKDPCFGAPRMDPSPSSAACA